MFSKKMILAVILPVLVVAGWSTIVRAEDKWVSNVFGSTTPIQGGYSAFTSSTAQAPYLEVYMKSWGACCPRYKGGAMNGKYNAYNTNNVVLSNIYRTYTTRHLANTQYGGIEFYTSDNGTHSTFCWWSNGRATC